MSDTISRKGVFIPDITVEMFRNASLESIEDLMASGEMEDILLPSAQPEVKEIGYAECANVMLKMWIDNVLTDGEYNRIMDKLNTHHDAERRQDDESRSNSNAQTNTRARGMGATDK